MKVLFVCLGNICRSPAAEGIFRKMVEAEGLSEQIKIDSAGTNGLHNGEAADSRMRAVAAARGYNLESKSRQIMKRDLVQFDYILAMDKSNRENIIALGDGEFDSKVQLMLDYSSHKKGQEVPDPYYGGADGFKLVIDLLEDSCKNLLKEVKLNV